MSDDNVTEIGGKNKGKSRTGERDTVIYKTPSVMLQLDIGRLLSAGPSRDSNDLGQLNGLLGRWKEDLAVIRESMNDEPSIISVSPDRIASLLARKTLAAQILDHIQDVGAFLDSDQFEYKKLGYKKLEEAVEMWAHGSKFSMKIPKSFGFMSDPDVVFKRAGYNPDMLIVDEAALSLAAPYTHGIVSRLTNMEAACAWFGRVLKGTGERKQVLWVHGPADGGKSQLQWLICELLGGCEGSSLDVTSSDLDDERRWWTGRAVGKRLICVTEADGCFNFLRSGHFKSITGDPYFTPQIKCQHAPRAINEMSFCFFGNHKPSVGCEKEYVIRIILATLSPFVGERIPEPLLRKELAVELPAFAGYCLNLWAKHEASGRIPHDATDLLTIVAENEETFSAVFEDNFIADPDSIVPSYHVKHLINSTYNGKISSRGFISKWKTMYGLIAIQKKIGNHDHHPDTRKNLWHLKGLRVRTSEEGRVTGFNTYD